MQDGSITDKSDSEIGIDTPKLKKALKWSENEAENKPYEDLDNFKTPKTLEKASKAKFQLLADGSDIDVLDERLEKAFQVRDQLLLAGSDIDSMDGRNTDIEGEVTHESDSTQTGKGESQLPEPKSLLNLRIQAIATRKQRRRRIEGHSERKWRKGEESCRPQPR